MSIKAPLAALGFALFTTAAQAAPVTINYEVTGLSGTALSDLGLNSTDVLNGSVTFDDDYHSYNLFTADFNPSYDTYTFRNEYGTSYFAEQSITIGGTTNSSSIAHNSVSVGDYFEEYSAGSISHSYDNSSFYSYMHNVFGGSDFSYSYVQSYNGDWDSLTPTADDLNSSGEASFYLYYASGTSYFFLEGSDVTFSGAYTAAQLAAVPLPASGALMLIGFCGLWAARRKQVT